MTTDRIKYRSLLRGLLLVMCGATIVQSQNETVTKCYNDTDTSVCFTAERLRNYRLRNWTTAMDYCQRLSSSTLPTVMSPLIQFHLTEFLVDNDFTLDSVWLGGRGVSNGWTWVDGSSYTGNIPAQTEPFSVAAIAEQNDGNVTRGILLTDNLATESIGYICQYKDRTNCSGEQVGGSYSDSSSCFARYDESISWSLARNKCLMRGADLAILITDPTDAGIKTMLDKLSYAAPADNTNVMKGYWIGLRKIWWNWMPASDNSEIKTAYFKDNLAIENENTAEQNCLAIDYKQQFAWGIRDCSIALQTICQGQWPETPKTQTTGSTQTVSLPVWAVGLICGLCGLFYTVSLIVVGIICCKCCGNQTSKKNEDNEGGRNRANSYAHEPRGVDHGPSSQPTTPSPITNGDGDVVQDDYDEFDDDYEVPKDNNNPSSVYSNLGQVEKPPGIGRLK